MLSLDQSDAALARGHSHRRRVVRRRPALPHQRVEGIVLRLPRLPGQAVRGRGGYVRPCPMLTAVLTDVVTAIPPLLPTAFLAQHTGVAEGHVDVRAGRVEGGCSLMLVC